MLSLYYFMSFLESFLVRWTINSQNKIRCSTIHIISEKKTPVQINYTCIASKTNNRLLNWIYK